MIRKQNIYSLSVIISIAVLSYFNTFENSFHYDDFTYIIGNEAFKEYVDHPFSIARTFSDISSRSVVLDSLYLNYSIDGFNVFGYHLFNLAAHILVCMLVFIFLKETLRMNAAAGCQGQIRINLPLISSLLFAIHPLNIQTVTYISNRSILLATCFYLISFILFIKSISSKSYLNIFSFIFLSFFFILLGYGSKIIIMTAPALFIIYYLLFITPQKPLLKKLSIFVNTIVIISPFILLFISSYVNKLSIERLSDSVFAPFSHKMFMTISLTEKYFSSYIYMLTEFKVVIFYYLKMIIIPFNQNIDPDFPIARSLSDISVLLGFSMILLLLMLGAYFYKKNRLITLGIFWFYIALLPTSSMMPLVDTVAEHRIYLPYVGLVILFSSILSNFNSKELNYSNKRAICSIIFVILPVILLSSLTIKRNFIWKDEISLWQDASNKSPWLRRPFNNLGKGYEKEGEYDKAIEYLKKAIALSPGYDYAHNTLGTVYGKTGQFDLAIKEYKRVLEINYSFTTAHYNIGKAYEKKGMLDQAAAEYFIAIKQQKDFYQAYFNLADIYKEQKLYQKAVNTYLKYLKFKPNDYNAYFHLGKIFIKKENLDKAFFYFTKAVLLNNNYLPAKIAVGNIYMMRGDIDKAEETYKQAIKIDPANYIAYNNLALIYLNHRRQPSNAMAFFERSLRINPDQPNIESRRKTIRDNTR